MSTAAFNTSYKEVEKLLKNINLLKSNGIKTINTDGVSQEFKTASQKKDYFNLYKCAIKNFDYDLLLFDDSIFQFSYKFSIGNLPQIRYAYFQNPQEYKSYNEYLDFLRISDLIGDESDDEIGNVFEEEYEQFLTEQNLNSSANTIRFDLDEIGYSPLIHSVAHFHIGHSNDVRIPCNKILTPFKFVLFVIKHTYYTKWKSIIELEKPNLPSYIINAKSTCLPLGTYWNLHEEKELFIT